MWPKPQNQCFTVIVILQEMNNYLQAVFYNSIEVVGGGGQDNI